jgi:hypothetical protein
MKKRHIAVLMSLLFASGGMVALAQSQYDSAEAVVEIQAASEPAIVVEEVAVVTDESEQSVIIAESTTAVYPAEATIVHSVQAEFSDQPKQMSIAEWLQINAFRTDEVPLLPAQIAYYERLDNERRPLLASSAVIGSGGEDEFKLSSAQTAYFDRQESQRSTRLARSDIQSDSPERIAMSE